MPGIQLFGWRWRVAADDFVFSSMAEILLRTAWLIAFSVIVNFEADEICSKKPELLGFYIGMIFVLSLSIIVCAVTMFFSMQGTLANANPRRHVVKVIKVKVFLFIVELGFVAFGTYLAFGADTTLCSDSSIGALSAFVIMMWIVLGFLIVAVYVLFDPRGKPNETDRDSRNRKGWIRRLKCLFCCCVNITSDKTSDVLDDIATLITDYLGGIDFVASDVTAGLLLVQEEQKRIKKCSDFASIPYSTSHASTLYTSSSPEVEMNTSRDQPEDWMTLPSAHHFMNFAMGSYGWPLFVYANPCTGLCKLTVGCKCCSCIRTSGRKDAADGDNCCSCNVSAITRQTGIPSDDIIYANFTNKIYEIPFYVALDHIQEAVVIAIRGTLSVKDSITDLDAGPDSMDVDGVSDAKAHKGILRAAHYIKDMINSPLEIAFSRKPGYRLVLTGHSLGAGAAAILAVLLHPVFPKLICFAFSPPGWLLSLSLSRHTESFICSIVVGVDIIPRLGIATMEKLRDQMNKAIDSCNRPKYQVLGKEILKAVCCCRTPSEQKADPLTETNSRMDVEANNLEETNQDRVAVDCTNNNNRESGSLQHKLILPGRVLYLHEVQPKRGCGGVPIYEVHWRKPESFDEILLNGSKMFSDHFPDAVLRALFSASQNSACAVPQSIKQRPIRTELSSQPIRTVNEQTWSSAL